MWESVHHPTSVCIKTHIPTSTRYLTRRTNAQSTGRSLNPHLKLHSLLLFLYPLLFLRPLLFVHSLLSHPLLMLHLLLVEPRILLLLMLLLLLLHLLLIVHLLYLLAMHPLLHHPLLLN